MRDLDQIKQGEQGGVGLARAASKGQVGPGRAVAATTSTATRRERDAVCFRFAANNSEKSRERGETASIGWLPPARADFGQFGAVVAKAPCATT